VIRQEEEPAFRQSFGAGCCDAIKNSRKGQTEKTQEPF